MTTEHVVTQGPHGEIITVTLDVANNRSSIAAVNKTPQAAVTDGGHRVDFDLPPPLRCDKCGSWVLARETNKLDPVVACECTERDPTDQYPPCWGQVAGGEANGC